jgi:8-oxo-dGTP diphosphatase
MDPPDGPPRESQTIRLPGSRLATLRPWATDGTALTAAARVRDADGRVALVRNGWSEGWLPPGGAVEPGEAPPAAAAREVREETGLDATVREPLLVLEQTYVDAADGTTAFEAAYVLYDARAEGPIPPVEDLGLDGETIRAARWFETLPERLHDDDLLRPSLREDGRPS